jgi:hypothetical protein
MKSKSKVVAEFISLVIIPQVVAVSVMAYFLGPMSLIGVAIGYLILLSMYGWFKLSQKIINKYFK